MVLKTSVSFFLNFTHKELRHFHSINLILGEAVADFTPTWVLVVTWLNLAADEGCRWTSIYNRLYPYWWLPLEYCKEKARNLEVNNNTGVVLCTTSLWVLLCVSNYCITLWS